MSWPQRKWGLWYFFLIEARESLMTYMTDETIVY